MELYEDLKKEHERLRIAKEKAKQELVSEWQSAVDENGTFFHVFGDPEQTGYAVQIEVGYTEEDAIYAQCEPISELEDCIDERELETLEMLVYEEAEKLDDLVAAFAHSIYDYLYGLCHHKSLLYNKYSAWKKLEKDYKASAVEVTKAGAKTQEPVNEFRHSSQLISHLLHWENQFSQICNEKQQLRMIQELYTHEQRSVLGKTGKIEMLTDDELWCWSSIVVHIARSIRSRATIFSHTHNKTFVIPSYARCLTLLTELNLSHNDLVVIPQDITNLPHLRKLFLGGNRIRVLPPLGGCPALEVLDCHHNEITAFPSDLGSLTKLQTIDLEYNKITVIPDEIVNLKRLQFLALTKNQVKLVPPQIGLMTTLHFLKLAYNPIVNLPAHIYVQGTSKILAYLKDYIPEAAHITQSSLVSDLAKYANREAFSDLILRVTKDKDGQDTANGRHFFAHRVIVDARCPYLYASTLKLEEDLKALASKATPNGSAASDVNDTALALSAATISSLPSETTKRYFDNNRRLIVDVDVNEEEMEYLLTFIYGDVFEPTRPEIINVPEGSEIHIANSILDANSAALKKFYAHCEKVAQLAERFELPRMAQLAKQIYSPSEKVPATTYFKDLQRFASKPKHSDVAFLVDGRTIPTHKVIICARSEYFNSMLTGGLLESTLDVVPLPDDVRFSVAKSIIDFCYTDDVTPTAENVMDILMMSRVYGIERLKGMIETVVGYSLDPSNAPSIYSIAELYSFKRLRKACRYFILSNWHAVTAQKNEWNELDPAIREYLTKKAEEWRVI